MSENLDASTRVGLLLAAADPSNRNAREEFAKYYGAVIRDRCRRHHGLHDADADDIAQTLVLRLMARLSSFRYDPSGRYRAYVRKAVERSIKDLHRARQRRPGGRRRRI